MTPRRRWQFMPSAPPEHLTSFPGVSPLVLQLLYNRGVSSPEAIQSFLSASVSVDNPFLLQDMSKAVTRLRQALRSGERIAIYGDYDVDGVTATALLVTVLQSLGGLVVPYIPNRMQEGYGVNAEALQSLRKQGINVVITVDCGVRAIAETAAANEMGLDMIITDHHGLAEELPAAVAVIDPHRDDDRYPFKDLAGVGLAYKLAQALLRVEGRVPTTGLAAPVDETSLLDLVALGTVADLAPLLGENRALVRRGLAVLNEARRPGVAAMLQEAGLKAGEVDAFRIGFVLGPRLNAAGRIADAMVSYQLLMTRSAEEGLELAEQLGAQNRERQRLMDEMVESARREIAAVGEAPIYVLAGRQYLSGIAGLVASRITDEFYRPSLVIAMDEKTSRGSARSIEGLHITHALDECKHLLNRYGGHAAAAGFDIANDNIDALRSILHSVAERELTAEDLIPLLCIDMLLPLSDVNWDTWALIEGMEPFGVGNPYPVFASYNVRVRDCRVVGRDGSTLKLALSDGLSVWDAIAFRAGISPAQVPARIDVAYTLHPNVWNGRRSLQMHVRDIRPAGEAEPCQQ